MSFQCNATSRSYRLLHRAGSIFRANNVFPGRILSGLFWGFVLVVPAFSQATRDNLYWSEDYLRGIHSVYVETDNETEWMRTNIERRLQGAGLTVVSTDSYPRVRVNGASLRDENPCTGLDFHVRTVYHILVRVTTMEPAGQRTAHGIPMKKTTLYTVTDVGYADALRIRSEMIDMTTTLLDQFTSDWRKQNQ